MVFQIKHTMREIVMKWFRNLAVVDLVGMGNLERRKSKDNQWCIKVDFNDLQIHFRDVFHSAVVSREIIILHLVLIIEIFKEEIKE